MACLAFGLGLVAVAPNHARAQEPAVQETPAPHTAFPIDDANPKASLPPPEDRAARPLEYGYLLLEMTGRAEEAFEAKDFPRAVRYFEALVVAVPEAAIGHRKLCMARSAAGDVEGAIAACRQATRSEGAQSGDLSRLLASLLARPAELGPDELAEFDEVLLHAEKEGVDLADILPQACTLAVRVRDDARLAACVERLEQTAPGSANAASFAWALAMRKENEAGARQAFEQARAAGHDAKKLAEMKLAMDRAYPSRTWIWAALATAAVAGVGAVMVARKGGKAPPHHPSITPAS